MVDTTQSIKACAAFYGKDADKMELYLKEGEKKALDLGNRGPIKFDDNGNLCKEIRKSYSEYGFYIFENVIDPKELNDIKEDLENLITNFPTGPDSKLDAKGDPAFNADSKSLTLLWSKPLGDPLGGTELANGRHQIKLFEPEAPADAPLAVPVILLGSLQFSDACLRTYAHPKLLKVAESINGEDFAPFNEALFIKEPGVGAAVSWHQDGVTHWDSDDFNEDIHGFNFMIQLYGCTPANGVWVVPGTHKNRTVDIKEMVNRSGSERIKEAVPMVCKPGDVVMSNRQVVHGSFANTSPDWRVTINQGFHRRKSVLNVKGGGLHGAPAVYDEARVNQRSSIICKAISARQQKFPHEKPYEYKPFEGKSEMFKWDENAKTDMHDYNLLDFSI